MIPELALERVGRVVGETPAATLVVKVTVFVATSKAIWELQTSPVGAVGEVGQATVVDLPETPAAAEPSSAMTTPTRKNESSAPTLHLRNLTSGLHVFRAMWTYPSRVSNSRRQDELFAIGDCCNSGKLGFTSRCDVTYLWVARAIIVA